MTEKLYDNGHLREFDATVVSCVRSERVPAGAEPSAGGQDVYEVVLDRTAFFPEGGGQFADQGTLGDSAVLDVQLISTESDSDVIVHYVDAPLPEGAAVHGVLDWDLRFRRMQEHSGEHIVSGLVCSTFGCRNIGFHLGDDDTTCDYNMALTEEQVRDIEARANAVVFANLPVTVSYPDPAVLPDLEYRAKLDLTENVRLVTIEGVDVCACCAPHVSRTGEIGLIKIVHFEKAHGGTRLHLRCGFDALEDYQEKQSNIQRIMDLCSAPQAETAAAVQQLTEANGSLKHELSVTQVKVAEAYLSALPAEPVDGNLVLYLPDADTDTLRALCNGGREKCTGLSVALTNAAPLSAGQEPASCRYMITAADGRPLSRLAKTYNEALHGRGGGHDDMLQGAFGAAPSEIRTYFVEVNNSNPKMA